jgi:hypothetical protein
MNADTETMKSLLAILKASEWITSYDATEAKIAVRLTPAGKRHLQGIFNSFAYLS